MPTSLPRSPLHRRSTPLEMLAILMTLAFIVLALSAAVVPAAFSCVLDYAALCPGSP